MSPAPAPRRARPVIVYASRVEVPGGPTLELPPEAPAAQGAVPAAALARLLRKARLGRADLLLADPLITPRDTLGLKALPVGADAEFALSQEVHRVWAAQVELSPDDIAARHLPTRNGIHIEAVRKSQLKALAAQRGVVEGVGLLNLHLAQWAQKLVTPPALAFFVRPHYMLTVAIDPGGEIAAILPRTHLGANLEEEVVREISQQSRTLGRGTPSVVFLDSEPLPLPGYPTQRLDVLARPLDPALLLLSAGAGAGAPPPLAAHGLRLGAGMALAALALLGLRLGVLAPLQQQADALRLERDRLALEVRRLEGLKARRDRLQSTLQAVEQGGADFPALLDRLGRALPPAAGLVEVALGAGKSRLVAEASSPEGLLALVQGLEGQGLQASIDQVREAPGGFSAQLSLGGWEPAAGGTPAAAGAAGAAAAPPEGGRP